MPDLKRSYNQQTSLLKLLMTSMLAGSIGLTGFAFAQESDDLGELPVRPHLLVDMTSGDVLSHHMAFDKWAPASLTKMMTAYTVFKMIELQSISMQSPVRISEESYSEPPSRMGFPIGTVLNIETALKIIMVKSANDISVALAEAAAGSEENFVALMNAHARRLGMKGSRFSNPHGLHEPDQFTTARDMALLTLKLTEEFPQYSEFFNIPALRFENRRLRNHNALMRLFDGTNGMKTGYVCASGFNVAVRTTRDDKTLVAIVFGGKSGLARNIRAARLLQEGFDNQLQAVGKFETFHDGGLSERLGGSMPHDITKDICIFKYAADGVPIKRPEDAPRAEEFDAIDTRIVVPEGGFASVSLETPLAFVPTKRPRLPTDAYLLTRNTFNISPNETQSAALANGDAPESVSTGNNDAKVRVSDAVTDNAGNEEVDKPLTKKQLAAIYFAPVTNLRKDVTIQLGGGIGPNPYGLKHTNGTVYQAPIPVPIKRPPLDLNSVSE